MDNNYTLDLNSGLTQVLAYGDETYSYGLDRLGYSKYDDMYTYLPDALGSVRQVMKTTGEYPGLSLAKSYDPYGEVIYSNGAAASYGFTGEQQDSYIKLVNLRSRLYSTETGRFLTKDTWQGDYNTPLSLNKWNYVNGNPVNLTDPSGATPLKCEFIDDYCHWYGLIPDDEGIERVNNYKSLFLRNEAISQQINNANLDPTSVAAAIAVQSQWLDSPVDLIQELIYEYYCGRKEITKEQISVALKNTGIGPGGLSPNDIPGNGDPRIMSNAIKGMVLRIANNSTPECLAGGCSDYDKLVIIGMAQNGGGFHFGDLGKYAKTGNKIIKNINWELYFSGLQKLADRKDHSDTDWVNDTRAGDIKNFNTRFQLKLFIQNVREMVNVYDWPLPKGIKQSDIESIYILSTTGKKQ